MTIRVNRPPPHWGLELVLHPEAEQLIRERTRDVALEQGLPYETPA
jgi:hypothetical protein